MTQPALRPILSILAENKLNPLRRARLLAARRYGRLSPARRAALQGYYDRGRVVQEWVR